MALVYNTGFDYLSKIGEKEIKFKQWTAKEERKYLSLLADDTIDFTDKTVYETLILPCIQDKNIVLSASEQKKLLMDIRIESISEFVEEKEHECPKCEGKSDIKEEINNFMTYTPAKYKDITEGVLIFKMGPIRTNKEKEVLKLADGVVNYVFNDFLLHIHAISIDGVMEDGFKFKELQRFMDDLPTKIFDEIFNQYKDMVDDLNLDYKWTCPKCQEEETIDYSNMPNLLWA